MATMFLHLDNIWMIWLKASLCPCFTMDYFVLWKRPMLSSKAMLLIPFNFISGLRGWVKWCCRIRISLTPRFLCREGDLRVIRPFINVREKALRDFAESEGLPIIPENCPACFDAPTERHRVKQLLAQQEILFPKLYLSLRSAMHPLMAINKTGMESTLKKKQRVGKPSPGDTDSDEDWICCHLWKCWEILISDNLRLMCDPVTVM